MNQQVKKTSPAAAIVLSYKNAHGIIKHPDIIHTPFSCTLSFEMYDTAFSKIIILISGFLYAVTQIHILSIHKKSLIKASCFIQHLLSYHHKCAGQHIYFIIFIFIEMTKMIP